ncbi:MAG: hypothetical protein FWD42_09585, partial [Solirubrobacterales bacterium]|nr:hypothetical protein [Solirubrobacterales bacterium]
FAEAVRDVKVVLAPTAGGAGRRSLRALGPGAMAPVWHRLHELQMPVQLLAGERDPRYVEIGERMAALMPAARLTIVPGGHALLLENPRAVARAIEATPAPGGAI